jgi:hydrogenase-4 component F
MGLALWIVPLLAAALTPLAKKTRTLHAISIGASLVMLAAAGWCTFAVAAGGELAYGFAGGLFLMDSLSAVILDIVTLVYFLTSVYAVGYLDNELAHGAVSPEKIRLYYLLMYAFLFAMVLALTVSNLGILWVAIEATTLASAFLVGFQNNHYSLEAAWKYILICSVGIAITLVGIIFVHLSSVSVLQGGDALRWDVLLDKAKSLDEPVLRFAFLFIVIGFGTKAGLAPMHTWLPDAHSQAPSPVSALLSGVLLNSAMYAILRCLTIVNAGTGDSLYAGKILIGFGLLSVLTAAIFILTQKDYKRLLAYSSIEHMGIIALAMGLFTPLSVFAGLFHMMNHSLTKSMLFLASGNILQKYNSREIAGITGLLRTLPVTGPVFLLGILAISGTPPFSVFASELNVFISIFDAGKSWLGLALILLLAVIFAGMAATLFRIFFASAENAGLEPGETNLPGALATGFLLLVILATGLFMPEGLRDFLNAAGNIVLGG